MGMILEQLETPLTQTPADDARKLRRNFKRSFRRSRRSLIKSIKSQYYPTTALRDAHKAYKLNEDIALATLIVTAVLSFATVTVLANALFVFMQAANVMSTILHLNLAILVVLALAVIATLVGWASAWQQNLITIALTEGANRKVKRSLKLTLRTGLRRATDTATAWFMLLCLALAPAAGLMMLAGLILLMIHPAVLTAVIALGVTGLISLIWAVAVLVNLGLTPYVILLEKPADYYTAVRRARQLVASKGRWFIAGTYLGLVTGLAAIYLLALGLHHIYDVNVTAAVLTFGILPLTAANACLTMLYRKRKNARS